MKKDTFVWNPAVLLYMYYSYVKTMNKKSESFLLSNCRILKQMWHVSARYKGTLFNSLNNIIYINRTIFISLGRGVGSGIGPTLKIQTH